MTEATVHTNPYFVDEDDHLKFDYHEGQKQIMASRARFILALAGTQSGKTIIGPWWLFREICREGRGDYMVVAPSFPLMQKKVLPEFLRLFKHRLQLGSYNASERVFTLSGRGQEIIHGNIEKHQPTKIFFGHAQDPDSLESATAKAAWLDEAGQKKFKFASWEAIIRRLSIYRGRVLITTTPYTLGWLKNELHDEAEDEDDIDLIQFDSTYNPAFPEEEYRERKRKMPTWKFNMMYKGIFERPAGMIYDCFSEEHKIPRFEVPRGWNRYLGLDFGGVNTVCIFIAEDPNVYTRPDPETGEREQFRKYYAYRTYKAGGKTASDHAKAIKRGEPGKLTAYGGAPSEDQWRDEFTAGGLHVHRPPIKDVEVGIDRVYSMFSTGQLFVFDDLPELIDDIESYSRELGEDGEPTEKIEDKETFHHCDGLRYICSYLEDKQTTTIGGANVDL